MYYNQENPTYRAHPNGTGLIPRLATGAALTIQNLGIDNSYLNYQDTAAAFLGTAMGGNAIAFSKCYAGESVTVKGGSAAIFRGYAHQQVTSTSITDCYSLATTVGTVNYGLVGSIYDTRPALTFTNTYNANGPLGYGGNIGYYTTAINCYATAVSSNSSGGHAISTGVTVKTAQELKGSAMSLGNAYKFGEGFPTLKVFDNPGASAIVPAPTIDIWDGQVAATAPTDTNSDGWIEINNGAELAYIIKNGGGAGNKYKLTADIYLNDTTKINWDTGAVSDGYTANTWYDHSEDFQGEIDGDGYVIYGLYFNSPGTTSGPYGSALIPVANGNTTIKNLGIDNAYVSSHNAAAFVAACGNNIVITMDNCYVGENVTLVAGQNAAALVAHIRGSVAITNCYSNATTTGPACYGLVGDIWNLSVLENCYNSNGPHPSSSRIRT